MCANRAASSAARIGESTFVRSTGPTSRPAIWCSGTALGGLAVRARAYTGDGLTGALETYGRTQGQLDLLDVKLELRRVDDNSPVTSIPGEMKDTEPDGGGFNRRVSFVLPLTQVPPGEYLARATVSAGGEVVAERTRHVEVLAGRAAVGPAIAAPAASAADVTRGDLGKEVPCRDSGPDAGHARRGRGPPGHRRPVGGSGALAAGD